MGLARVRKSLKADIVKRSDHAKGFEVVPKRWLVERSIAWLNRKKYSLGATFY
jgi:transposase